MPEVVTQVNQTRNTTAKATLSSDLARRDADCRTDPIGERVIEMPAWRRWMRRSDRGASLEAQFVRHAVSR